MYFVAKKKHVSFVLLLAAIRKIPFGLPTEPKGVLTVYVIISMISVYNRVFIRPRRSENSSATTQNFLAECRSFSERALLRFHNDSPVTLLYSPATTILDGNPAITTFFFFFTYVKSLSLSAC